MKIGFILSALFSVTAAWAAPTLTVGTASGPAGTVVDLSVTFNAGKASIASLQFDLAMPSALITESASAGEILKAASKNLGTNMVNGKSRFLIFGLNKNPIKSGTLLTARIRDPRPGPLPESWCFRSRG